MHCGTTPGQRALMAAEAATRTRGRPSSNTADLPLTQRDAAALYGIDPRALRSAKRILESGDLDLIEQLRAGSPLDNVVTELRRRQRGVAVPNEDNPEIRRGDFIEVLADVRDNSVHAIVTDVPWPPVLDVYDSLAKFAHRVLVPGGVCAALVGQRYLPDLIDALRTQLTWCWQMSYLVAAGPDKSADVYCHHYPVTVWTNGPRRFGLGYCSDIIYDRAPDVIRAVPGDKSRHEYAKSIDGMAELIGRVSNADDLVVDPFAGSGSVGFAALRTGRRFIGAELRSE